MSGSPIGERRKRAFPHPQMYYAEPYIWSVVQSNVDLTGAFLPLSDYTTEAIGPMFLLARQSESCIQGSGPPIKETPEKETDQIEACSITSILKSLPTALQLLLCHRCFSTECLWPVLPKLIYCKINLRLIIIASHLITSNSKKETPFAVVNDFNYCIINKSFLIYNS